MSPNRIAFGMMIGTSEGTVTHPLTLNGGYDVIVTGIDDKGNKTPEIFTDYRWHPFAIGSDESKWRKPKKINSKGLSSTASGKYQILRRYWLIYERQLKLAGGFTPENQELYLDQQLRERNAYGLVESGHFDSAVRALSGLWASMPGIAYANQRQHSLDHLRAVYAAAGGNLNDNNLA